MDLSTWFKKANSVVISSTNKSSVLKCSLTSKRKDLRRSHVARLILATFRPFTISVVCPSKNVSKLDVRNSSNFGWFSQASFQFNSAAKYIYKFCLSL